MEEHLVSCAEGVWLLVADRYLRCIVPGVADAFAPRWKRRVDRPKVGNFVAPLFRVRGRGGVGELFAPPPLRHLSACLGKHGKRGVWEA